MSPQQTPRADDLWCLLSFSLGENMKLNYLTVILIVFISTNVRAADNEIYPCEVETKALMTMTSSWEEIYEAAIALPPKCFDGYFAEGISDTLICKMGTDWDGFMKILSENPEDETFLSLILKSINATLSSDDINVVAKHSNSSCIQKNTKECEAISKQAAAVLSEMEAP